MDKQGGSVRVVGGHTSRRSRKMVSVTGSSIVFSPNCCDRSVIAGGMACAAERRGGGEGRVEGFGDW